MFYTCKFSIGVKFGLSLRWLPWALSLGVKWPGREADHSSPPSAEVKECVELYLHSPNTSSWRGVRKQKHRDNFTFTQREEHRLKVFENRVLRRLFEPKREEMAGGWRRLHNEEYVTCTLY
jgi:hypothetical protein